VGLSVSVFRGELNREFSKRFEFLVTAPRVSQFDGTPFCPRSVHIAHLRQECHNSKFGIFELLV
jgi:hypothetical protein